MLISASEEDPAGPLRVQPSIDEHGLEGLEQAHLEGPHIRRGRRRTRSRRQQSTRTSTSLGRMAEDPVAAAEEKIRSSERIPKLAGAALTRVVCRLAGEGVACELEFENGRSASAVFDLDVREGASFYIDEVLAERQAHSGRVSSSRVAAASGQDHRRSRSTTAPSRPLLPDTGCYARALGDKRLYQHERRARGAIQETPYSRQVRVSQPCSEDLGSRTPDRPLPSSLEPALRASGHRSRDPQLRPPGTFAP